MCIYIYIIYNIPMIKIETNFLHNQSIVLINYIFIIIISAHELFYVWSAKSYVSWPQKICLKSKQQA